jgi:hypothetical protein
MNAYEQLTLGQLIDELKRADPNHVCAEGFGHAHSYRGDYSVLAFSPKANVKVRDMLAEAERAVGDTFPGWKGGDYRMQRDTVVHLAESGECTDGDEITLAKVAFMLCREHRPCPNCGRA